MPTSRRSSSLAQARAQVRRTDIAKFEASCRERQARAESYDEAAPIIVSVQRPARC